MQLSVVVPVYRSAQCLPELVRRVEEELARHFDSYELILVNDNSPDACWDVIQQLISEYDFVVGVNLRKNSGQDNAIMAGLRISTGEVVVIMDDDLQHDPADIPALYRHTGSGFDVVYAKFIQKQQALWKRLGSRLNDRLAVFVLGKPSNIYMSPYKAVRREVIDEIVKYTGPYPYVDGLIFTVTSNITEIAVRHHGRFAGESNYNILRSCKVWLKLATGFSAIPLRIAAMLGAGMSVLAFALGAYLILQALVGGHGPEGWASVIVSILFIGGVQLICIGMVGEYIGRIFITQNMRPQFVVKEICRAKAAGGQGIARRNYASNIEAETRVSFSAE